MPASLGVLSLASAACLLASGGLGCWVSMRESVWLQAVQSEIWGSGHDNEGAKAHGYPMGLWMWFVYVLVIVLCLEATAAALAYFNIGQVHSELAPFRSVFQRYTGSSQDLDSNAVDATQDELQCCGIHDYKDWLTTPWFNHSGGVRVPHSCCNSTFLTCNGTLDQPWQLYPKGCQIKLEEALLFVLSLIMWSSLAVAVVEIVGFVSVAQLMRDQPLLEYRILDRD
ncbi:tetraspanin 37 isoform X3 [Osmerus eperlanus]|uniref:tetraspanin 37 isoform X3 n=1 Tax=Osmerus eperlanus TaxID=29151 RepID=UPI002E12DDB8